MVIHDMAHRTKCSAIPEDSVYEICLHTYDPADYARMGAVCKE